jgi:hypothetical protein
MADYCTFQTAELPPTVVSWNFTTLPASIKTYHTSAKLHQTSYWTWFVGMSAEDCLCYNTISQYYKHLAVQHPSVELRLWTPPSFRLNAVGAPLPNIRTRGPREEHHLAKIRGSKDIDNMIYVSRKGFRWGTEGDVLVRMNSEEFWRWASEASTEEIIDEDKKAIRKAKQDVSER